MKQLLILSILSFSFYPSFAQKNGTIELNKWIKENNIVFGSPRTPEGFLRFSDCDEVIAFKKEIGDSLIIYSRGGSIAENVERLNESINTSDWNMLRYPIYSQNNGTIVVQNMRKWIFLIKADTLYLLDEYDNVKDSEHIRIMERYLKNEISEEVFAKLAQENYAKDFGFKPKFKVIYFKGIFDESDIYSFNVEQNFREESVSLIRSWTKNGIKYFEIDLKTHTSGKYVISEDFNFINTEKCNE